MEFIKTLGYVLLYGGICLAGLAIYSLFVSSANDIQKIEAIGVLSIGLILGSISCRLHRGDKTDGILVEKES